MYIDVRSLVISTVQQLQGNEGNGSAVQSSLCRAVSTSVRQSEQPLYLSQFWIDDPTYRLFFWHQVYLALSGWEAQCIQHHFCYPSEPLGLYQCIEVHLVIGDKTEVVYFSMGKHQLSHLEHLTTVQAHLLGFTS